MLIAAEARPDTPSLINFQSKTSAASSHQYFVNCSTRKHSPHGKMSNSPPANQTYPNTDPSVGWVLLHYLTFP
jgi:hypothetical protein